MVHFSTAHFWLKFAESTFSLHGLCELVCVRVWPCKGPNMSCQLALFLIRMKTKAWLSAKEAALCYKAHQRENVSFQKKRTQFRERKETSVNPPLGRYRMCWRLSLFVFLMSFSDFIPGLCSVSLFALCVDFLQRLSLDPSTLLFILFSPPLLPYMPLHFNPS